MDSTAGCPGLLSQQPSSPAGTLALKMWFPARRPSITWERVGKANSPCNPRPADQKPQGWGPAPVCLQSPPGGSNAHSSLSSRVLSREGLQGGGGRGSCVSPEPRIWSSLRLCPASRLSGAISPANYNSNSSLGPGTILGPKEPLMRTKWNKGGGLRAGREFSPQGVTWVPLSLLRF